MSEEQKEAKVWLTPPFRVNFPAVFQPTIDDSDKENPKETYSVVALFPKDADLSPLRKMAGQAVIEKWGKKPHNLMDPFRDQGEKDKDGSGVLPDGYEDGAIFINMKTGLKPQIFDQWAEPLEDESEIYSGCWAQALVSPYAWEWRDPKKPGMVKQGVKITLIALQKVKDDEPIGGLRVKATDYFRPIAGAGEKKKKMFEPVASNGSGKSDVDPFASSPPAKAEGQVVDPMSVF